MASLDEENLALVKTAYEAGARGDWDTFFANVTDETLFHEAPSLPYGGIYRGRADIQRGSQLVVACWENFQFKVLNYMAGGDVVVAHVLISGVGRKTGKSFSMPIMELWRIKDGKVVELRPFYWDTHRCLECLG